ncbi:MAG: endonuclease/exonuclease/phosphatase family protein [Thermodesulfobacteriota bacterium]
MQMFFENKNNKTFRGFFKLLSRNHWFSRLLNLPGCMGSPGDTGLILIQIDGLSYRQFQTALGKNRMPHLKHLLNKKTHTLKSGYSGLPSSTPAYQAELLYGLKSFVPAFEFIDRRTNHHHVCYKPESANHLAKELTIRGQPLLSGGNAYAMLFSGGANEARYCTETMDLDSFINTLNPAKLLILMLLHTTELIKIITYTLIEFGLAIYDFFKGIFSRQNLIKEFTFIPSRVLVCIILRELVRFRLKLDVGRGIPVVCANFLGYDEQSHRRGPDSAFAHWSLKGIDNAIRDIHKSSQASQCRTYEIIIYSDHGQERVDDYESINGVSVKKAIRKVFQRLYPDHFFSVDQETDISLEKLYKNIRSFFLKKQRAQNRDESSRTIRADEIRITTMGPLGHIYLPRQILKKDLKAAAWELVVSAAIPLVFFQDRQEIYACDQYGLFRLSDGVERILGKQHPHRDRVISDLKRICSHQNAGDLVISGWQQHKRPLSFSTECGAHGGPGKNETHPFLLIPSNMLTDEKVIFRAEDLRQVVQTHFQDLKHTNASSQMEINPFEFRIVSFNIHSCKSFSGRRSPERTLDLLSRMAPDIVALQEVDVNCKRTGYIHQADFLAQHLKMTYYFHPLMKQSNGQYGLAILSRFPLSGLNCSIFPNPSRIKGKEPRGFMTADIRTPAGTVRLINTHFGLKAQERLHQAETIIRKTVRNNSGAKARPTILCGDLNAGPGTDVYKKINAAFNDVQTAMPGAKPAKPTFISWYPVRRIDHIFVSDHFKVESVVVPDSYQARRVSDHLPVLSRLSLKEEPVQNKKEITR